MLLRQERINHDEVMAKGEFQRSGSTVQHDLGWGFSMPLPILLEIPNEPRAGFTTRIDFVYSSTGPLVNGVQVSRQLEGIRYVTDSPVTGELLREVAVAEICKENLPDVITRFSGPVIPPKDEIRKRVEEGASRGLTLALVQQLYLYAELTGQKPAKFVQETMGLAPATASRWIRKSKEKLQWDSLRKRPNGND